MDMLVVVATYVVWSTSKLLAMAVAEGLYVLDEKKTQTDPDR